MGGPDMKELFRSVLAQMAGSDGDLGTMEESLPALTAVLEQVAAPDFTCTMRGLPPTPPVVYQGVSGVTEAWNDYGEAFEEVRARLEGVRESEDHVVVLVDQLAVTKHGGVEVHQPSAMVFRLGAGTVEAIEFHLDRAEALRTAGLADA